MAAKNISYTYTSIGITYTFPRLTYITISSNYTLSFFMEMINCIQAVLIRKKISQKELAKLTGKSLNSISSMCTNKSQPHLKELKKIAEMLDVDIRELLVSTRD
jgi:putative transcriptional regulator